MPNGEPPPAMQECSSRPQSPQAKNALDWRYQKPPFVATAGNIIITAPLPFAVAQSSPVWPGEGETMAAPPPEEERRGGLSNLPFSKLRLDFQVVEAGGNISEGRIWCPIGRTTDVPKWDGSAQ